VTVWEFVGKPDVKPLAQIPKEQIESELDKLMELLESQSVTVHFDRKVSVEEAYRFLSEELMKEEMDEIRIEGMHHNFIYTYLPVRQAGILVSLRKKH